MRLVTYGVACSLDGFIAGPDNSMDWLHFSKDAQEFMAGFMASVDTLLMGRKTWEVSAALGGDMGGIKTYVFSTTLGQIDHPAVELVSSDAGEFVRRMKDEDGKGSCVMGGGELACSLLRAGVIDEVSLNVHPLLLGWGVPLFRDAGRIPLDLLESRVIDGGCVLSRDRVRPG
ncbi:MAG: dihydrofolate reductase family protein [Gemmatimonadetes bacterium]|nr:dihydrofolate reductase family protein [Gemmatimonadota bacterium]